MAWKNLFEGKNLARFFNFKKNQFRPKIELKEPGWRSEVKEKLEQLIAAEAGSQLPVVLDLDNTVICRDIGEATFAVLEKKKLITLENIPPEMAPDFILDDKLISLKSSPSIIDYYHRLEVSTAHHFLDSGVEKIGYNWAVSVMDGLTPLDIVKCTEEAYGNGIGATEPLKKEALPLRPFFYPEMVELIGVLLDNYYDVWVISSSNSWSVRWMMLNALNQLLAKKGFNSLVQPTRVMGINSLLKGPTGQLYKDGFLVWENPAYAMMDPEVISQYRLTNLIVPPETSSYGKVAEILHWIGKPPYLVAGDSFGDVPMLNYAQNCLWMARLERPDFQEYVAPLTFRKEANKTWMIQPILTSQGAGFVNSESEIRTKSPENNILVERSLEVFDSYRLLKDFWR